MSKFNIEEGQINSKESDRFDLLPNPIQSFTAVFVLSSSPLLASLGWVRGQAGQCLLWQKTVTKHACPLSLTTFLVSPSAEPSAGKCQHVLQGENVFANLCAWVNSLIQ